MTVLLHVEDDADDAYFARQALLESCPEVVLRRVSSARDARDYLEGRGAFSDRENNPLPDRVLLDLTLPEGSAIELLRWIKSQRKFAALPVTLATGEHVPSDLETARALGVAGTLAKGNDLAAFKSAIRAFCEELHHVG
jgi:CheY-like chemotaxis protein